VESAGAAGIGTEIAVEVETVTDGVREVTVEEIGTAVVGATDEEIRRRCVPIISIKNRRQRDKNLPCDSTVPRLRMAQSNEEVMRELARLRTEIQQLREVVSALFNAVFEEGDEDWETVPEKDEFNLYN